MGAVGAHAVAASWGIIAVGLFANSQFEGIEVRDGLFHGGGWAQLGSQVLEIVAIIAWSIGAITPFFYITGVVLSRKPKDPRAGLRLEFPDQPQYPHQADPRIHDCREDNIDMKEVMEHIVEDKEFLEEMYKVMQRVKSELELNGLDDGSDDTVGVTSDSSQTKLMRRRTLSV